MVEEVRYLGVHLDDRFSFIPHVKRVSEKAKGLFQALRRFSGSSWGIGFDALRTIYRATYVAQVTYAARVWSYRLGIGSVAMALLRGQRAPLLAVTRAYRTSSSEGLPVIAGVLPADLEVLDFVARRGIITTGRAEHLGLSVVADATSDGKSRAIGQIRQRTLEVWQERWDKGKTGRLVYKFLPSVADRMRMKYLNLNFYEVQLVTGHGELRGKLFDLGLRDDPNCACGMGVQYAEHVLWECPLLDDAREEMLKGMSVDEPQPIWFGNIFASASNFGCFRAFVRRWVERWDLLSEPR
jgi:hypothetical protein